MRELFELAFLELWDMSVYQDRLAEERLLVEDVLGEAA
jgi:hypothetical protein